MMLQSFRHWYCIVALVMLLLTSCRTLPDKGTEALHYSPGSGTILLSEAAVRQQMENQGLTVQELMLQLLKEAQRAARPAISNYQVGAVCQGLSGKLYFGANIEFPGEALSFSVHAEQAAVINAYMHGEEGISALAITAAPCGRCRQFLNEAVTADKIQIILPGKEPRLLRTYLPDAFGPADLGIKGGMMQPEAHGLHAVESDSLVKAALQAANECYAPYTTSYSGVAIKAGAQIFAGAYVENAAFNPSISPFQAALILLVMNGTDYDDIEDVVLVEKVDAKISQLRPVKTMLNAIAPEVRLRVVEAHHQQ